MKILNKYVLREHVGPLFFALTALTSLLLLNYIAKRFGQLVGKGLPWSVIGEFFLLSIPFTVAMTIPMAVLVSTLYAFSRLAAENEITAFKASGISVRRLLAPVLVAAVGLAVFMVGFNDQVLPRANYRLSILQSDIFRKKPTFALREQVTNKVSETLWLRAGHVDDDNLLREVVIYDFGNTEQPRTIHADSGTIALTPDERNLALTLYSGTSSEFPRGKLGEYQRTRFERNRVLVADVGNQLERSGGNQPRGDREMTICQMQARYDSLARDYELTASRIDELVDRARRGGATIDVPPRRETYSEHGLGALYCRFLGSFGVKSAIAAEPPAAQQDSITAIDREENGGGIPGVPVSSSSIEILSMQADLASGALNSFDVEIQKKFALAVACIIFVLLGAPIALRFPRGGVGLVIGVSLGVFALYYVALIAGESIANKGYVPPFVAMWAANVIFGAVGLLLLARMGREGATARGGDMSELLDGLRARGARLARAAGVRADRRHHR